MSISSICQERLIAQLNNKPPPRNELQPSPYELGFTKMQLDMRRKVEILEYKPVKTNSQTNTLTKSQRWSHFVRNGGRASQTVISQIANNEAPVAEVCPQDRFIPKPTSASDVPGPIMDLVYDPNVPLYNYKQVGEAGVAGETETITDAGL